MEKPQAQILGSPVSSCQPDFPIGTSRNVFLHPQAAFDREGALRYPSGGGFRLS
jgi:hypothetical protein